MIDYRINLHEFSGIDPATQAAMLDPYHTLLEHELECGSLARQSLDAA